MTILTTNIVNDLRSMPWDTILNVANGLEDLNDAQLRFAKGLIIEKTVEYCSNQQLKYVGAVHKDFDWLNYNLTVELKSNVSGSMYYKNNRRGSSIGSVKPKFSIKLSNTNGTNKKTTLNPNDVADILIGVYSDGAFVVDKPTVLSKAVAGGDGWTLNLTDKDITPIAGPINISNPVNLNFKQIIYDAIEKAINDAVSSLQPVVH